MNQVQHGENRANYFRFLKVLAESFKYPKFVLGPLTANEKTTQFDLTHSIMSGPPPSPHAFPLWKGLKSAAPNSLLKDYNLKKT